MSSLADTSLAGTLHAYFAFDWGEAIDLEMAGRLETAAPGVLARRRRTPSSIAYRPPPLVFQLPAATIALPVLGPLAVHAEATVFDIGAVSLGLSLPIEQPAARWVELAGGLADSEPLAQAARDLLADLHARLQPALRQPLWSPLGEEYFVFRFSPGSPLPAASELLREHGRLLAALVRLEPGELSETELAETLRHYLSYTPRDLFLPAWSAAVLVDDDCEETLRTVEFANLQLLEFRHIDLRLDDRLEAAYATIYPLARRWLPFWQTYARPLRALGELKVEASGLFERTSNALKLVGDQYLARVYRLLAARFHLGEWEADIRHTLNVVQEVYQVVADQAATYRIELLEIIVIVLILVEVMLGLLR